MKDRADKHASTPIGVTRSIWGGGCLSIHCQFIVNNKAEFDFFFIF